MNVYIILRVDGDPSVDPNHIMGTFSTQEKALEEASSCHGGTIPRKLEGWKNCFWVGDPDEDDEVFLIIEQDVQ